MRRAPPSTRARRWLGLNPREFHEIVSNLGLPGDSSQGSMVHQLTSLALSSSPAAWTPSSVVGPEILAYSLDACGNMALLPGCAWKYGSRDMLDERSRRGRRAIPRENETPYDGCKGRRARGGASCRRLSRSRPRPRGARPDAGCVDTPRAMPAPSKRGCTARPGVSVLKPSSSS